MLLSIKEELEKTWLKLCYGNHLWPLILTQSHQTPTFLIDVVPMIWFPQRLDWAYIIQCMVTQQMLKSTYCLGVTNYFKWQKKGNVVVFASLQRYVRFVRLEAKEIHETIIICYKIFHLWIKKCLICCRVKVVEALLSFLRQLKFNNNLS